MFTQRKLSRKNLVATGSFTAGKEGESVGAVSPAAALDRTSSASSAGKTPAFPISRKKTAGLFRSKSSKKADLDLQESSLGPAFSSSGTAASIVVNDAVRTLQLDKLATLEDESLLGDTIEKSTDGDGYSGMADYKEYINKSSAGMRAGPLRSSTYVRTSSRFDYAPDVCKDYKDSGYCGFGDSCKFMHDRTDYKSGWQLEREYEEQQKRKREPVDVIDDQNISDQELSDTDDLPFAVIFNLKIVLDLSLGFRAAYRYAVWPLLLPEMRAQGVCKDSKVLLLSGKHPWSIQCCQESGGKTQRKRAAHAKASGSYSGTEQTH